MSEWAADEVPDVVTPEEADQIASRFNASHWKEHSKEHARYSIPANPRRDDDIRLAAFIERTRRLIKAAELAVAATGELTTDDGHPLTVAHFALRAALVKLKA